MAKLNKSHVRRILLGCAIGLALLGLGWLAATPTIVVLAHLVFTAVIEMLLRGAE